MLVVDTNIICYLMMTTEHTLLAKQLFQIDSNWIAPSLWRSEMRNVLALYEGKKILTLEQSMRIQQEAEDLMAEHQYDIPSFHVLKVANQCGCSAYESEFIVLAKQLQVPFVTADERLVNSVSGVAELLPNFVSHHYKLD